jgi:endonuclease/exonuclease/phosphatase (EEP) superfamily protein YafD
MTFNIWGGSRTQETAQVILADGSPDIVAIQELDPQMTEILLDEVGAEYPYRVFQTDLQSAGMGVLSRYPLTELDTSRLAAPGWEIQVLQVQVDRQAFILYNCRLHGSNVLVYLEAGAALADEVRASFEMRQSLIHRLVADIASRPGPVMVVGDFNSTDQSDVYAILTSHLTDAHQAAGWGLGHTFPAYRGSFRGIPILPLQMRLDMILYSEEFTAASSRVGSSAGESDHLPVLAQLVWPR